MSPRFLIGLVIVLFFYLLLCAIPYLFENQIIFQGTPLAEDHEFNFQLDFTEHSVKMKDGTIINALLFKNPNPKNKLIFYCHGNADNLQRWGNYAPDLINQGYDILMHDYRGYGKSEGTPSKEILLSDAIELFDWSQANFSPNQTVLYGRSLGASIASYVATQRQSTMLILETPFYDLNSVMKLRFPWMIQFQAFKNNFSNAENLKSDRSFPLHIIHGDYDKIVPLESGQALQKYFKIGDSFTIIPGGKHKNLAEFKEFGLKFEELLGD